MTGFGSARRRWASPQGPVSIHVELRSVNGRYLEVKLRQPFGGKLDASLRKRLGERLGRGRVELSIALRRVTAEEEEASDALAGLGVDASSLAQLLTAAADVVAQAEGKLELLPSTPLEILRFLQSVHRSSGHGDPPSDPPEFLHELVDEALGHLCAFRDKEGAALAVVVGEQLDELAAHAATLRAHLPSHDEAITARIEARIDAVAQRLEATSVDAERVAAEVAMVLARSDVTEELDRIDSHLAQAREVVAAPPAAGQGKTLEFVAQELFREITTIGSKISSHQGSRVVIEAKGTIERIREQVSNVE